MKTKISYVIISLLLTGSLTGYAETVNVGYFEIIPHLYSGKNPSEPQGASIEYANAVFARMGYQILWTGPLPYKRLHANLKHGDLDGTILTHKSPEREEYLYFTQQPYYLTQPVFVVRKEYPLKQIQTIDDIKGMKIGLLADLRLSPFIRKHFEQLEMDYTPQEKWIEINLRKLQAGRIDAIYDLNPVSILVEAKKLNMLEQIRQIPLPEPPGEVFIVFSKKSPKGRKLLEECNRILPSFTLNYQDLLKKELER